MACRRRSASPSLDPTGRVIALLGDGSAMYSIQDCGVRRKLALPVAFVIGQQPQLSPLI